MITRYALPEHYGQELMDAVCAWLSANDINPGKVPLRSEVTVRDDEIDYYEQKWDSHTAAVASGVVWTLRTVPLIAPMPAELARQWPMPPRVCPRCGTDINQES